MAHQVVQTAQQVARRPLEQEWDDWRPVIERLYIEEKKTLPEVVQIMEARGFHATDRMFKGRLNKWGADTKTTKRPEWEAMHMMWQSFHDRGEEVEFTARNGTGRSTFTRKQIDKQLLRYSASKREEARIKVAQAGYPAIFRRKDIRWQPATDQTTSDMSSLSDSDSSSQASGQHSHASGPCFDLQPLPRHYTTPFVENRAAEVQQAHYISNSVVYFPRPNNPKHADLVISARFDQMHLSSPLPGDHPETHASKTATAEDWAYHVFMTNILTDRKIDGAGKHREWARQTFRKMLAEVNPHILTSFFHMSAVLWSLGRLDSYLCFLRDCCQIIDEQEPGVSYMTPYRYVLALETGDQDGIKRFSDELEHSTNYCRELFGDGSPHVLASMHFQASHLLEQVGDVDTAIKLLESCLAQSDNVFDYNHLLNVNCIALLARAYKRQGRLQVAIDLYVAAAERCKHSPSIGSKHPYRLRFLQELALLQAEIGLVDEAKTNLMIVLEGRRDTLGPAHKYTWSALEDLKTVLGPQHQDVDRLQFDLRRAHWSQDRFVSPKEAYMP